MNQIGSAPNLIGAGIENLATRDESGMNRKRMEEVGQSFESVFLSMILKEMRNTLEGGGLALDYYLTDKIGIGLEGSWIDTPSVIHGYNVNLTYRLTCPTNCLSAYVLGGGGVYTNGETVGSAHLGGGVEYRFTDTLRPTVSFSPSSRFRNALGAVSQPPVPRTP